MKNLEQIKLNVKEWEKTKSIHTAGETMALLVDAFEEEDGED